MSITLETFQYGRISILSWNAFNMADLLKYERVATLISGANTGSIFLQYFYLSQTEENNETP